MTVELEIFVQESIKNEKEFFEVQNIAKCLHNRNLVTRHHSHECMKIFKFIHSVFTTINKIREKNKLYLI